MKYKLLVVDVDGTLVDKDGNISAGDKEAVTRARQLGIQISLSTGRAAQACLGILDQLSLDGYHMFFDGALVSEPRQGIEIYVQPIDSTVARQAIEFAHQNDIYLEFFSSTHYFVERESWASEIRRSFFGIEPTVVDFIDLWRRERFTKAQLIATSPQEAAKAKKFYTHFDGRLRFSWAKTPAYPNIDFINVIAPEVSKGKALEALASHLGVSLDEVMAVGDGTNDIPLLTSAGLAVAMGDAPDEVKAVADYVTLDIDHNGLAVAIKKFLL
jgi:Cof subfamily protein (haloacid dehalogenase superfamily)